MSKSPLKPIQVYCGELCKSSDCNPNEINLINYGVNDLEPNVTIGYEGFVCDPNTLSDRILDLLQIAAMVFCADRMARRGERESIENESWARSFEFHISVLDFDFWQNDKIKNVLADALCFMTGDRSYVFDFHKAEAGHFEEKKYHQLSLFPKESDRILDVNAYDVMLFSGGLDSLAGLLEELSDKSRKVITVSHKSNYVVVHLQKELIGRLNQDYGNRILPYGFSCHNRGIASVEETQRTRMFLFSAIAFAICECYGKHRFFVYENGVTSLNYSVQTDVINARASRTTHPKTLGLLRRFYRIFDSSFEIVAPYYKKTKEDIVKVFQKFDRTDLIASAVSCSSTRTKNSICPHCGVCSQCIDRRFAVFAAGLEEYDGEYATDFIREQNDDETQQRLYRQMHFASAKDYWNTFELLKNYGTETQDAVEFWPCDNPEDSLHEIHDLLMRYSDSALRAAQQMQLKYDDLRMPISEKSFLKIISNREYLLTPFERRVEEIDNKLKRSLHLLFHTEKPKDENDFNDKVMGLLSAENERWFREYPTIKFGITHYRADGFFNGLIIESKYVRKNTSPSVASQGIAADITQIPTEQNVFFVVYDPDRRISDDEAFCNSFKNKKTNCVVKVYR
jgi:7-cyano-7-deazaguanine synthase in queuosine biosynthesis